MENKINIEQRLDGDYIITGQKHKGQDIVIKIGSTIDSETVFFEGTNSKNANLTWTLEYDEGLYVELKSDFIIYDLPLSAKRRVDTNKCIEELVLMVKNNKTLDICEEIKKEIYNCNNEIFRTAYNNGYFMYSNNIIECLVAVTNNNKILGYGSRFILNRSEFTICEYVGQTITRDMDLRFSAKDEIINLNYIANRCIYNDELEVYSKGSLGVGYLKYSGAVIRQFSSDGTDIPVYPKLKVPYTFSDREKMIQTSIILNTADEILAYKLALRGKIETIDVNKYMLNEYLI